MTNVSVVEKMAELMQQMEENSPRVATLQYCLTQVAEKVGEAEKRNAELEARCEALAAENAGLKAAIEYCINPDNQPEYHDQGMGCGVEDHGYQRDGYSACYYGWESAMERVYSEVIPDAIPETPATDAFMAEVRASALDEFARAQDERAKKYYELSPGCSAQDECQFAAGQAWYFAECIRKGVQS